MLLLNVVFALTSLCLSGVGGHNILVFHNLGTPSHLNMVFPIVQGLLDKGHSVTGVYYTAHPSAAVQQHSNYSELVIPDLYADMMDRVSARLAATGPTSFLNPSFLFYMFGQWGSLIQEGTGLLVDPDFKAATNASYDAVLTFNPWGFWLAEQLDCPAILFSPTGTFHSHSQLIGNTFNPSYQPVVTNDLADPTSFRDRLKNFASYWIMDFVVRIFADAVITGSIRSTIGYEGRSMFAIARDRLAIILSNSHYLIHSPQPQLPNLIDVGGVHIRRKAEPLPRDIEDFLDSAAGGAVYVSFGSAIKTSRITAEKRAMFLDAFRQLNLPVILKWDNVSELVGMPANVMARTWLPQQDILAHPKVELFVTHGGLFSLLEGLYHATKMVGLPLATDQFANMGRAKKLNIARQLSWDSLNTTILVETIKTAIKDRSMKRSIQKHSRLFRDQQETPLDRAIWWTEFAIRNKGAAFFRPNSEALWWHQYVMLDILLFLAVLPMASAFILYKLAAIFVFYRQRKFKSD